MEPTKNIPDIAEGWVNKPKGAFQVLYERGWINQSLDPKDYTMKGKLDPFGNRNLKTSLKSLILCQPDFMNQKTMLQYYCEKLGILSDRTPVAHCEIAGEGIEFNWGCAKLTYRGKPIGLKQNKNKFHTLVESVLSNKVLTISICRANARRARQYMLAYMTLKAVESDQNQATQPSSDNNSTPNEATSVKQEKRNITHSLIERCVRLYRKRRSHRNVRDFDIKYLNDKFIKNVLEGMSTTPKVESTIN